MNIKQRIEPSYKGKHSLGAEMDCNQCTFLVPRAMGSGDICSVDLKFAMMSDCCMPPNSPSLPSFLNERTPIAVILFLFPYYMLDEVGRRQPFCFLFTYIWKLRCCTQRTVLEGTCSRLHST